MVRNFRRVLVTGGAGFVGSALCRLLLEHQAVERLIVVDCLTYAGKRENLPDDPRVDFHPIDITDITSLRALFKQSAPTCVFHLAAESHVDRSISRPADFVKTNVVGTCELLECCREVEVRLIHVSTDEVYGSAPEPTEFTESSSLRPSSPYSASKAAADLLCLAAAKTYGQDIVITRSSNNYGPRQHVEKLIPQMVMRSLVDEPLPIYGSGKQVREWIHVDDHCRGLIAAALLGKSGEIYHLGTEIRLTNLDIVERILTILDKPHSLICHVTDRLGHDQRYALNTDKAQNDLGWQPILDFEKHFNSVILQIAESNRIGSNF